MDFEDPRLKNILKLKKEFEKELEKMGKLKKKPQVQRKKFDSKIRVDITPPATVDASKVTSIFDINRQDYDAGDRSVVKALRKGMAKIGDVRRRTLLDGIVKMLEGDLDGAKEVFGRFDDENFKYMLGVVKLYSSDPDVLDYALRFLKSFPRSPKPYLLLSEIMMGLGKFQESVKFIDAFKKLSSDPYVALTLALYNQESDVKKRFTVAVNKGGFKSLLAILSMEMEKDLDKNRRIAGVLKGKDNACCLSSAKFWLTEDTSGDLERYPFCPRLTVMSWARKFESGNLDFDPRERAIWNDPIVDLFLGIYSHSIGESKSADEYFERFSNSVDNVELEVLKTRKVVTRVGMRMFYEPMTGEVVLRRNGISSPLVENSLTEAINRGVPSNHVDIKVEFRDPEILRLVFGQRHCKFLYS